uniref:Carboxylic ester hydrolase n=1 Tax=Epiphyas postvittana TaxID=65032 RepID=A0A0K8TUL2_EPIPO
MADAVPDLNCIINTKDGPVRGYVDKQDDSTYYTFKGIPYAKPPLGSLRFMPPQQVAPWTEVLDCTKDSPLPACIGRGIKVTGQEDCLYLEVITPNLKPAKPMPVMFWMSSYGFAFLIEEVYDPALLNDQDVIYVHCNARVGPLGFLSINDISAPGNAGLKDLVMGLKWVQKNISAFGGDPDNVTIFGTSSGGSMVHFMMLSPMATGLFHKAIIQSASALHNWSIEKNPTTHVQTLASKMGISSTCMLTIVEELKCRSTDDIMNAFYDIMSDHFIDDGTYIDSLFKPCIENEFEGQQVFISKSPLSIIKSRNFNKVPIIIGSNNIEALVLEYIKSDFYEDFKKYNENVKLLVPRPIARDDNLANVIGQKLLKFYLGGEEFLNEDTKSQYLQLISDYYFLYYVNTTVKMHATYAPECPIYYYVITYSGEWTLPMDLDFFNCVGHHGEIPFIFRITVPGSPPCKGSRDSVKTRSRVVRMWTNFAKYGNPTPDDNDPLLQIKWDPIESENKLNYLCIGSELTKGRNPFSDRMAFWDDLHKQHSFLKVLCCFQDLGISC